LNGNQINAANNYQMNNQIQMPLKADISISASTTTTTMSTTTSFASTYANTTQTQHTTSFTQPIEGISQMKKLNFNSFLNEKERSGGLCEN
jgi:hypothetical protein